MVPSTCEASYCEKQVMTMFEKQLDSQVSAHTRDSALMSMKARFTGDKVATAVYSGPHDILLTLRFMKERGLLTVTIEAPFLGPTGSNFKDGEQHREFRLF